AGLETTMTEANITLKELTDLLKKESSEESNLGELLNEKGLYNNIEETTANLNLLLQDMRLNPRRYFRLFGKKSPEYIYPEQDPAMINIEDK
ncbi:MAG: MCE family protein, partial [Saprospiraceae bacterium]|nr:MCE family protein [Saprospiraceae bacterium]